MDKRIPDKPPFINPIARQLEGVMPTWSVMIPVYNCSKYLPFMLQSVLQQCRSEENMQIEIIDDCSTDADVEKMVLDIGKGRVGYYRQASNVGSLWNFQTCIARSKGEYIHLLHGDDLVKPGFYEKMESLFINYPTIGAAFCRYDYIDQNNSWMFDADEEQPVDGILEDWLFRLFCRQRIQTPSIVVKRSVYEDLGSFYAVKYGEDWEMWLRIAEKYLFAYTPNNLASYRIHENSISGQESLSGQNIRDLKHVMDISIGLLPVERRREAMREAKKFYAKYAVRTGSRLWKNSGNADAAKAQIKEALSLHVDEVILFQILKLNTKLLLGIR